MDARKFLNGHALREENKVIYFIPKLTGGDLPIDLTVLEVLDTSETWASGRKSYEGYKANITADTVKDWGGLTEEAETVTEEETSRKGFLQNVKNALNHNDNCKLTLSSLKETPRKLEFWKNEKGRSICFGRLKLETIELVSSMGRLLETVICNLLETSELNFEIQTSSDKIHSRQSELESLLKKCVQDKARMEDRMCRAFMKLLNTKKKRIRRLMREVNELKRTNKKQDDESKILTDDDDPKKSMPTDSGFAGNAKKKAAIKILSSSEEDPDSATDYDSETDVNDSDETQRIGSATKSSTASAPTPKKKSISPSSRRKSSSKSPAHKPSQPGPPQPKCAKKLFATGTGDGDQGECSQSFSQPDVADLDSSLDGIGGSVKTKTSKKPLGTKSNPGKGIEWSQSLSSQSSESSQELFPPRRGKRKTAVAAAASKPTPSTSRYQLRNALNKSRSESTDDSASTIEIEPEMNKADESTDNAPPNNSQPKRKKSSKEREVSVNNSSSSPSDFLDQNDILNKIFDSQ